MSAFIIRSLQRTDRSEWTALWGAYLAFYGESLPPDVYHSTWERLFLDQDFEPKCLLAVANGKAVGLAHYLYHRSCWSIENKCYLQDLYTLAELRGTGIGTALIEAVRNLARQKDIFETYWMTHETNVNARRVYDRIAKYTGFIEYSKS